MSQATSPYPVPNPAQHVLQLATGYMISAVLNVAVKLNIADRLSGGPKTAGELARETGANEGALYRALRLLATVGLFEEDATHRFSLTRLGEPLRTDSPGSMRAAVEWLCDPFHLRIYAETEHAVRTGETVDRRVLGKPCFEYFAHDREEGEVFHRAMTNLTASMTPAILDAYDLSAVKTLVDVGGGQGGFLAAALKRYPGMKGILYDMPQVVEGAGKMFQEAGVAERCAIQSGDFFKDVPAGGDTYMMKAIIHDWADEAALQILRNCRKALHGVKSGRLLIMDAVIAPGNEPHLSKLIDIEMLLLPGGMERTAEQFRNLLADGGFRLTQITATKCPLSVVEAVCE